MFAVSAHHRSRMDLLSPSAGWDDHAARAPAASPRTRQSPVQEKPMTSLTSQATPPAALSFSAFLHSAAAKKMAFFGFFNSVNMTS